MEIKLTRLEEPFLFNVENSNGAVLLSDANQDLGGSGKGFRPMELVLAGAGGCAAIDLLLILKKQRQDVSDVQVLVTGKRDDSPAKAFNAISFHFSIQGEVVKNKLGRAISLALEKYCSVVQSLDKNIIIESTYKIN
jgi:putative redox protein|tara:strand:+ start:892 stop:1302 length:411 start_codon:yes stop_codon:yes gene_type:complete